MSEQDDKIEVLVKQAMPPADIGLQHDLWPAMLRRMQERPAAVPWFDWALLIALLAWFFFTPGAIPVFLYHM